MCNFTYSDNTKIHLKDISRFFISVSKITLWHSSLFSRETKHNYKELKNTKRQYNHEKNKENYHTNTENNPSDKDKHEDADSFAQCSYVVEVLGSGFWGSLIHLTGEP